VAVAATRSAEADLTLAEWARTLQKLELLPPLRNVFRLSFLGENSSTAYTVAGAFVDWLRGRHGAAAVRGWYGGGDLAQLTGKDLIGLERDWLDFLTGIAVSEPALLAARARFDRPAIFDRRCPHVVDRLAQQAATELGALDWRSATQAYEALLDLDAGHLGARLGLATCSLRAGDIAQARQRLENIARDPLLVRLQRAAAEEALADLDLYAGRVEDAHRRYTALEGLVVDPDRLRALDVKRSSQNTLAREAVVSLLVGDPRLGSSFELAAANLARWSVAEPEQGTADYLLGRNLYLRGRWREAAEHLDRALGRRIDSDRVRRAAFSMRLVVACALGDVGAATRAYGAAQGQSGLGSAERESLALLAERCGVTPAVAREGR
jgi:tetratricopeptide (TPR) repeat protein